MKTISLKESMLVNHAWDVGGLLHTEYILFVYVARNACSMIVNMLLDPITYGDDWLYYAIKASSDKDDDDDEDNIFFINW